MHRIVLCVLLTSSTLIMSCGSSQKVVSFWKNPKVPQGKRANAVFIIAATADQDSRDILENDLANAADANGVRAVRSIDVFPDIARNDKLPTKEEMRGKIKEAKCDAVFTLSMIDAKSAQRYIAGDATYAGGYGYAPFATYSYYGSYSTYVSYCYPMTAQPGYYTTDKTYFLEGNLYDAETEELRWSMQSSVLNPSDFSKSSEEYAKLLIKELKKQMSSEQ